jgi:DNA replication ATP-dependent helicase Dna2
MTLGNILHALFQYSITNKKYEKNELKALLIDILKQKKIINQLYENNLNEEYILKETQIYLQSIEKWLFDNIKMPLNRNTNLQKKNSEKILLKNIQITNVCDIEESIWSPNYGVKGKIDLTLQSEIKMSAFKHLTNQTNKKEPEKPEMHIIPVELKSGRTTFSAEHEGQTMLYALLNKEKRKASDFGLLLYLKDMNMKFIKVSDNSIRGKILIITIIHKHQIFFTKSIL